MVLSFLLLLILLSFVRLMLLQLMLMVLLVLLLLLWLMMLVLDIFRFSLSYFKLFYFCVFLLAAVVYIGTSQIRACVDCMFYISSRNGLHTTSRICAHLNNEADAALIRQLPR